MMNLITELEREKSHSDTMTAAAQFWMDKAKDLERTLAVATLAAGGEIVIHPDQLKQAGELELERVYFPHDRTRRLRVKGR